MASFHLELVAPDKLTFSGEVDQVDVPGLEGDFGILAHHAPTVALLRPGILTIYAGGTQTKFVVLGGFVEMSPQGTLTVLAEVASTMDDFDRAVLAARIAEAEENIKTMEQGSVLDGEIQKLDHYRQVHLHLHGTGAAH
ncbi:MAG: F0F1 ATP synthase subunit epsilon [Xanthobacteraceae bacterium]